MARPRKSTDPSDKERLKAGKRITVKPYAIGYAVVRPRRTGPGRWCTRIGRGSYIATPYDDYPGVETKVREVLRQRIEAHLYPEPEPTVEAVASTMTIGELSQDFERQKLHSARSEVRGKFHRALAIYTTDGDTLDAAMLTAQIREVQRTTTLALPSQREYLMSLRRMFDYAIERGWMTENPVRLLRKLPSGKTKRRRGFTADEMATILSWHLGTHKHSPSTEQHKRRRGQPRVEAGAVPRLRTLYLLRRLESLTGARIGELLDLKKSDIHPDHFIIHGKGHGDGPRLRRFPTAILPELRKSARRNAIARTRVEWLTEIVTLLAEAMAQPEVRGRRGMVFQVGRSTADQTMTRSIQECEIDIPDGHGSHSIRKYAIWYMREVLRLPDRVATEICGHDDNTAESYYRTERTPAEHARALWLDGVA